MITTEDIAERLLRALEWNDRDWHTAREVQRSIEERGESIPISELIDAVQYLSKQRFLDVVFTSPENGHKTGFSAKLTVSGREHLRKLRPA